MPEHEKMLQDHEARIKSLEAAQEKIQTNLKAMQSSLDMSEARAQERSNFMISQNESLMKQDERQATQLESVLTIVTTTKENDAKRENELKRLAVENRMKLAGYFLGGGGIVGTIIALIQSLADK